MLLFQKYAWLFVLSTFKFMFAPFVGVPMKLSFIETYLSCVTGAVVTATVFFFLSEYFMQRARNKQKQKREEAIKKGIPLPKTKHFSFMNKMVVKVKRTLGIYGICLWAPLFLSIPGGTIVSAKFFGRDKRAFPLILVGILLNAFIITVLAYSI